MAGFIRRFSGSFPPLEFITQIEGVVIVDTPPPGSITGLASGVVAMPGEFADMTFGTSVSNTGVVATKAQPVEVFTSQDLIDKVGGFDATLGDEANNGGNGFVALRNKKFSRLILVPVNLASPGAGRAWRDLPTNLSASSAVPAVALSAGQVAAGREFKSSTNRVHVGAKATFTALGHYANGTDGSVASAGAAATQPFNSAGSHFLTANKGGPVPKGAILVVGQIGGAGALGANAFTFRVTAAAVSDTQLIVQKMDGSNFDWTTGTNLPFRVHPQTDADTGGTKGVNAALADTAGYTLPCRPLDATIVAATSLTPTVIPPAGTASSWDPLSGLTLRSHQSAGFVYDANVQAPNAVNQAELDALYQTAYDSLLQDAAPSRDVNITYAARTSQTIRSKIRSHVLAASQGARGRSGIVSPGLQTTTLATAIGDSDPGVGATRDERIDYSWPGLQTSVPEAVNFTMGTADGLTTTDGLLDTRADGWLASVQSNLAPEHNPGESSPQVATVMSNVAGFQRAAPALGVEYTSMKAAGICGPRNDRVSGFIFQSGVTSSLTPGQQNINRRRFADFIEDSVGDSLNPFSKLPLTTQLKDSMLGEVDGFLTQLLSPGNESAQRIDAYSVDDVSGNTDQLEAAGVFVIIGRVRMTPTADFLVFQAEVGNGVVIVTSTGG